MKKFPTELEGILNAKGRRVLNGRLAVDTSTFRPEGHGFLSLPDLIDVSMNDKILKLFDRSFGDRMKRTLTKLPIKPAKMKEFNDNGWFLPIWNTQSLFFDEDNSREVSQETLEIAEDLNLRAMFNSESYWEFVKNVTGLADHMIVEELPVQLGAYTHGSYVGPHCDYYGTSRTPEHYIDVHFSFNNRYVKHMYLMYQQGELMSGMTDLHTKGGIGVYRLPMWHQSTPLQGVAGKEAMAKRWLVMTAVNLKPTYGKTNR